MFFKKLKLKTFFLNLFFKTTTLILQIKCAQQKGN
jgi:hypothetical protein